MKDFQQRKVSQETIDNRELVFGVGLNDADYRCGYTYKGNYLEDPYYTVWKALLQPYEDDITYWLCREFHTFSTFRRFMDKQDWQQKELNPHGNLTGSLKIDKHSITFE